MSAIRPSRRIPRLRSAVAVPLVVGAALWAAPSAASAATARPIGPNQSFVGVTKGQLGTDHILMICPAAAASGHPAGGQTVEVLPGPTAIGGGFTGNKGTHVAVAFPGPSATAPLNLVAYGVARPIPTTLTLPCTGTGTVRFIPLPTSKTARTDLVTVTFDPGPAAAAGER